jgi:hypothetical protein
MFLIMRPVVKEPLKVCLICSELYSKEYEICNCEQPLPILQSVWLTMNQAQRETLVKKLRDIKEPEKVQGAAN